MKIAFISNFINHHQVGVADELYKLTNHEYVFIMTTPIPASFIRNGYPDYTNRPYVLKVYDSNANYQEALKLAYEADVAILGGVDYKYILQRAKEGKLTFEYGERWLKRGWINLLSPRLIRSQYYYHTLFKHKSFYRLCASAYAANDLYLLKSYKDRCLKWGYFVNVPQLDIHKVIQEKQNSPIKILWVARFIEWKHPASMLFLAEKLKKEGVNVEINIVGTGTEYAKIEKMAQEREVTDVVHFLGSLPNEKVLSLFTSHHIFCFTSDYNEGWGAVLGEAMAHGCCPVVSQAVGAAHFLVKDGTNGFLFESQNWTSMYEKVMFLIHHPEKREEMTICAYKTMANLWNPQNAAKKLYEFSQSLLEQREITIKEGPCSKAVPVIQ